METSYRRSRIRICSTGRYCGLLPPVRLRVLLVPQEETRYIVDLIATSGGRCHGSPSFPALADNYEKTWVLVPLLVRRSRPEKLDHAFLWRTSRYGNSSTTTSATLTYVASAAQHNNHRTRSQIGIFSAPQITLPWTLSLRY
jgi:hypothetical protein